MQPKNKKPYRGELTAILLALAQAEHLISGGGGDSSCVGDGGGDSDMENVPKTPKQAVAGAVKPMVQEWMDLGRATLAGTAGTSE